MIQLEHVNKTIKGKIVLQDINLTLESGITYGLKGINGSGKTMLMRMIAGLIYPDSGKVIVDGECLGRDLSIPEHMGLLIENPAFLNSYTGFQNLKLLAELNGKADERAIRNVLERVGLDPDDRRKYRKYSLGMKQRLGIASAFMGTGGSGNMRIEPYPHGAAVDRSAGTPSIRLEETDVSGNLRLVPHPPGSLEGPEILILDEPLNALDQAGIELFEKLLFERKEEGKCLIVLACHDEQKLFKYADQIIKMEDGRCTDPVKSPIG